MRKKRVVITSVAVALTLFVALGCLLLPGRLFQERDRAMLYASEVSSEGSSPVPEAIRRNPLSLSLYSGAALYDYDRNKHFLGESEKAVDTAPIHNAVAELLAANILSERMSDGIVEALDGSPDSCVTSVKSNGQTSYSWTGVETGTPPVVSMQRDPYTGVITAFSWSGIDVDISADMLEEMMERYLDYLALSEETSFSGSVRETPAAKEVIRYSSDLQLYLLVSQSVFGEKRACALQVQTIGAEEYQRIFE